MSEETAAVEAEENDTPPWDVELPLEFWSGGIKFSPSNLGDLALIAKNSPAIFKSVKEIEQAALAAGVITPAGVKQTADPAKSVSTEPKGDVPSCKHGLMKDLRGQVYGPKSKNAGKPYPKSFYCTAPWDDADRCQPRD